MVDSKFFHIFLSLKFDKPLNQLLLYDKCFIRGPEKCNSSDYVLSYTTCERGVRGRPFAEDVLLKLSTLIAYYTNRAKKITQFSLVAYPTVK